MIEAMTGTELPAALQLQLSMSTEALHLADEAGVILPHKYSRELSHIFECQARTVANGRCKRVYQSQFQMIKIFFSTKIHFFSTSI